MIKSSRRKVRFDATTFPFGVVKAHPALSHHPRFPQKPLTPSTSQPGRLVWPLVFALFTSWFSAPAGWSDVRPYAEKGKPTPTGLEILQDPPHDLLILNEQSGGGWAKVFPIQFPNRKLPSVRQGKFVIEVLELDGKEFAVDWKDVETVDLWEERLERETNERIAKNDFVGAYPFLSILIRDFPSRPGLKDLRIKFLWQDAITRAKKGEAAQTLAMLEELRRYAPGYQPDRVIKAMSVTVDQVMEQYLKEGKLRLAQNLLARLEDTYKNDSLSATKKWRDIFQQQSRKKQASASEAIEQQDFRTARKLSREARNLAPELAEANELVAKIDKIYPLVNVGVLQSAKVLEPIRIDNWAARRAGRLVYRTMFEITGPGPSGGQYEFIFGETDVTPDRQHFDLILQPDSVMPPLDKVRAEFLADVMARRATASTKEYFAPWASAIEGISIGGPKIVSFDLRRPNVLPISLLQVPVDGSWFGGEVGSPTGDYRLDVQTDDEVRFVLRNEPRVQTQPREIVETRLPSGTQAVAALLRGDVDICDQLFPADAIRLQKIRDIRVETYPLPTVHMLVPCSDHAFLNDRTFRRALVYGTNRKDILEGELLGGTEFEGCQVVSGPFPAGIGRNDPLGYAYNTDIDPRPYEPPLARLLTVLATTQMKEAAERKKETPPTLEPIRLAFPPDSLSRLACEAIRSQWELIDLEVELVELPAGQTFPDPDSDIADIVYVAAAVWEPVIDARRILGPSGLAKSDDQLIGLGLRQLEEAINWKEVHNRLLDLHDIAHNELPVIPLWQMVDSYAYRRDLNGVGAEIVTLYQNAQQWRFSQ